MVRPSTPCSSLPVRLAVLNPELQGSSMTTPKNNRGHLEAQKGGQQQRRRGRPESCSSPCSRPCLRSGAAISVGRCGCHVQLGPWGREVRPTGQRCIVWNPSTGLAWSFNELHRSSADEILWSCAGKGSLLLLIAAHCCSPPDVEQCMLLLIAARLGRRCSTQARERTTGM
ncbi:hypothetical protein TRIUR3_28558 [Triticum urartu]|uniref:Uncharacterized protein n=1 Tax=Triticum urartu TaxID=4572 RepID=M8B0L5_TRIUA|nr:uncharacterized protein LOC125548277 isoform X2 [Triticum urartu]EMS67009.1 hypothetical protein TRIUR3_28558 [Triticum urartu]